MELGVAAQDYKKSSIARQKTGYKTACQLPAK
jgi:hypothetical protein